MLYYVVLYPTLLYPTLLHDALFYSFALLCSALGCSALRCSVALPAPAYPFHIPNSHTYAYTPILLLILLRFLWPEIKSVTMSQMYVLATHN